MNQKNIQESVLLTYSYLSYGLFGILGLRDVFLKRYIIATFKVIFTFVGFISLCLLIYHSVQLHSLMNMVNGDLYFQISFIVFLLSLSISFLWELWSVLQLTKRSFQQLHYIDPWQAEQTKMLLLFCGWGSFLGIPWFYAKKMRIAMLKVVLIGLAFFTYFWKQSILLMETILIISFLIDFLFGIIPCLIGRFIKDGISLLNGSIEIDQAKQHGYGVSPHKKSVTLLLAMFLGDIGAHNFYTRNWLSGIVKVLILVVLQLIDNIQTFIGHQDILFNHYVFFAVVFLFILKILVFIDRSNIFIGKYKDADNNIVVM